MAEGQSAQFGEKGQFKEFFGRELPDDACFVFEPKLIVQCLVHAHNLGRFLYSHEFEDIRAGARVELCREADWLAQNRDVEDIQEYSEYRAWQHRVNNEQDKDKLDLSQKRN